MSYYLPYYILEKMTKEELFEYAKYMNNVNMDISEHIAILTEINKNQHKLINSLVKKEECVKEDSFTKGRFDEFKESMYKKYGADATCVLTKAADEEV